MEMKICHFGTHRLSEKFRQHKGETGTAGGAHSNRPTCRVRMVEYQPPAPGRSLGAKKAISCWCLEGNYQTELRMAGSFILTPG